MLSSVGRYFTLLRSKVYRVDKNPMHTQWIEVVGYYLRTKNLYIISYIAVWQEAK